MGFLSDTQPATNLLESFNDWTLSLSRHNSVIIASIDFQRAFDSLSHAKLIHKLTNYGISGNLLFWLQSFLTNRTQCVRVGQSLSSSCSVSSGVPQGSVAGALLFILFINNISDHFDPAITTKLFADDLKIYTDISFHSDTTSFPTPPQSYPLMVAHLATKHCFLQMQHYATWRSLCTSPPSSTPYR